jgi:hypothetical protein
MAKKYGQTPETLHRMAYQIEPDLSLGACREVELMILDGKAKHFFITDVSFCDWLVDCVVELTPDYGRFLQELIGVDTAGVIHFPCDSRKVSMGFFVKKECVKPDGTQWPEWSCLLMQHSFNNDQDLFSSTFILPPTLGATSVDKWKQLWYAKLIIGIGMYLKCFPETMIDGLPSDLKHPSHHQHKHVFTVGISEKVRLGGTHDSPTPHFRCGHFRVLKSEKYTHKRFQTVFVHETFVKGQAKTVLSPEQADEQAVRAAE